MDTEDLDLGLRDAVKIILKRMQEQPEDFAPSGRFGWTMRVLQSDNGFTPNEIAAIAQAQRKWLYKEFHERVFETLLYPEFRNEAISKSVTPVMQLQGNSLKPSK